MKMVHNKFKVSYLLVGIIGIVISNFSFAQDSSADKKCGVEYDCFSDCPQIYISNPKVVASSKSCTKSWDYFVKTKDYCALVVMEIDQSINKKVDFDKVTKYLNQISLDNSSVCQFGESQDVETFKKDITAGVKQHKLEKITLCDLWMQTPNNMAICAGYKYDDSANDLRVNLPNSINNLTQQQKQQLNEATNNYLQFVDADNHFRLQIGQFGGSGAGLWSINSKVIMLDFYKGVIKNLINAYPDKFQTKSDQTKHDQSKSDQTKPDQTKSDQTKLEKDLNNTVANLNKLIMQIPGNSNVEGSKKKSNQVAKSRFAQAQTNWNNYVTSLVSFVQSYYKDKYTATQINAQLKPYLINRRIKELKDQVSTLKSSLKYPQENSIYFDN